jgi:hypothetical protein
MLSLKELNNMEKEFGQCYDSLLQESIRILSLSWRIKLEAMKKCSKMQQEKYL